MGEWGNGDYRWVNCSFYWWKFRARPFVIQLQIIQAFKYTNCRRNSC